MGPPPVHGNDALYERLCLEAFPSGLSWITILRRREGFRKAFADFRIAESRGSTQRRGTVDAGPGHHPQPDEDRGDAGERQGARAVGAGRAGDAIWSHAPEPGKVPETLADVPAVTAQSTALAKALKKAGIRFVGPTTAYALMQACGLVNDHLAACGFRHRA
ncbi:DNA-3-methyladenine glycosylase I [Streptomyces cirratus]